MIFDELVLHNFGVYGGRQAITLTPVDPEQPIILFGGLNGGGKTTLLDALQLCLYGSSATTSNRNGSAYEDYLKRCIHRGAATPEAALELAFRHTTNGQEHRYRLRRTWRLGRDGGCKDTFEVMRDGLLDRLATDNWSEQVEEFIPARIASLFLFDGEKVESYADLDGAPALIATAVHNLLGLDIVERLGSDLALLERRKRTEARGDETPQSTSDEVRAKIAASETERTRLLSEFGSGANDLDRARRQFAQLDAQYRREGGELYERRSSLETEVTASGRELAAAERELRDAASGVAPLLMVTDLLASAQRRSLFEQSVRRSRDIARALEEEHAAVLGLPALKSLPGEARAGFKAALAARRSTYAELAGQETFLDLTNEAQAALASLVDQELHEQHAKVTASLAEAARLRRAHDEARVALAAAPDEERLAELAQARAAARETAATLQAEQDRREIEIAALDRGLAELREREAKLAEAAARARFEGEDVQRVLLHSARVRATLQRFRSAVVAKHVTRIERLVLESFRVLIRKDALITGLRIDPATFRLELTGANGEALTPERLSAGERQLLAVAILWGLAKASGRPLPTVIDTPLGRLDSHHRARLIDRYFPHASHQVLLLSTDEEIAGEYYEALSPWVGRTYRLRFDQASQRTLVEEGYLEPKAFRDVA